MLVIFFWEGDETNYLIHKRCIKLIKCDTKDIYKCHNITILNKRFFFTSCSKNSE